MNLLILPSWFESPGNQNRGIFFKEQALALNEYFKKNNLDIKITIIALQQFNTKELIKYRSQLLGKKYSIDGISVISRFFYHIPKLKSINFLIGSVIIKKLIKSYEKENNLRFDLVHIHSVLYAGIWFALSGITIPYIITEHSSAFFRGLLDKKTSNMLPRVFNNAKSVLAVGNGLAYRIKEYCDNEVNVVFNIVNDPGLRGILKKSEVFTFLSIGYDIFVKGFDVLLEAFSHYLIHNNGILKIVGLNEESRIILSKNAEKFGIKDKLVLLDKVSHDKVFELITQCDCFVLASRFETFGIVLAEALFLGKPVIATRTGGPDSFVTDATGILVSPGSLKELSDALVNIKNDYEKFQSQEIMEYAKESFSKSVICEKLYNEYMRILKV